MSKFKKIGNTFFTSGDNGQLNQVVDKDTLSGLKAGQLQFVSESNERGLSFADEQPLASSGGIDTQSQGIPQDDIKSIIKSRLAKTLKNFSGVTNTDQLEARRQELLRKQLISAPFSEEGGKILSGSQKLSLLRQRGSEFDPELRALEEEIIRKKGLPLEELQSLSMMVDLATEMGFLEDDKKLRDLKIAHPEIEFADTMEEALGYLGEEIKKDKTLQRALLNAQIRSANAAAAAADNPTGRDLPATQAVLLSDGKFLPGLLDELENTINNNKDLIGIVVGRTPGVVTGDRKAKINDDLQRTAQLVGRFMEGGVLRKEDETKYRKMLPQLGDRSPGVALDKLEGVREMLILKYNNYLTDFRAAGFNVSGFDAMHIDFGDVTIKVRVRATGQIGTVPAIEFNPTIYEKIE